MEGVWNGAFRWGECQFNRIYEEIKADRREDGSLNNRNGYAIIRMEIFAVQGLHIKRIKL